VIKNFFLPSSLARALIAVLLLCFAFKAGVSFASDELQALELAADSAEIDEAAGWAVYSGNVELTQGSLQIQCDTLRIERGEQGIRKIVATGKPASYSQAIILPDEPEVEDARITASANQIIYLLEGQSIELNGNANIKQGQRQFNGHSIVYRIDERKIIARSANPLPAGTEPADAKPNSRVKIVLPVQDKP